MSDTSGMGFDLKVTSFGFQCPECHTPMIRETIDGNDKITHMNKTDCEYKGAGGEYKERERGTAW